MNPVVHFEMPAEDRKRMAEFYTRAFGWRTQMLGPEMGNYVVVTTTEPDEDGRPKKPGSINGGFFQKSNDKPDQYPSVVVAVDDIKEQMKKVKEAGGELLGEPMEIPGVGSYVSFRDTEGNRVAMLQPLNVMTFSGCSIATRLPSVSRKDTYDPTPGISIGSPSSSPPASLTFFICSLISSTATTTEGYWSGLSFDFWKKPPLILPGFFGRPSSSGSVVVTTT